MKTLVYVILDRGEETDEIFSSLLESGYNGTLIKTQSIKHILNQEQFASSAVLSLSDLAENTHASGQNSTCFFVLEEDKLEDFKGIIREKTDSFKKIHGAMFEVPILHYEGSF